MRYNYRCSDKDNCGARKTLPKTIEEYVRRPKCPSCNKDTLKLDPSVKRHNKKYGTCNCDGYSFPHRKQTEPWCKHSKRQPTEEDFRNRYG